jgi:hypothetical protein
MACQLLTEATLHNVPLRIIPLRCLNGCMAEQKLDLLQFAAGGVAQTSARSPQIVRRQGFDAHTGGAVSHYVPNYVLSYPVSPNRSILANGRNSLPVTTEAL